MPDKRNYRILSQRFLRQLQQRLDQMERAEMSILAKRWKEVMDALSGLIEKLAQLETRSADQLYRMELYKQFLAQSEELFARYAAFAEEVIKSYQLEFARLGQQSAEELMRLLNANFNRLPVEAIAKMIGKTSQGSPLIDVLIKRYGESYDRVAKTLIESTALGRNPLETARLIGADLNDNLYNTIRIARTEQIDIMRETARDVYLENADMVQGIDLIAEPDACEICLDVAANNPHPLDYEFDELHPNCRCAYGPAI